MLSGQGKGEQYRGQRGQGEQGPAVGAGQPGDSPVQGQHQGPGQQEGQEEPGVCGREEGASNTGSYTLVPILLLSPPLQQLSINH